MTDRADLSARFLASAGWGDARRSVLAGDASNRRYERITRNSDGRTAVLMDAPVEAGEDTRPFIKVTGFLRGAGLSAPQILAADVDHGFLLLEDLGDDLFARVISRQPELEQPLYACAIDLLVALHKVPPPDDMDRYDPPLMASLGALALDWYAFGASDARIAAADRQEFIGELETVLACHSDEPPVLIQRDFHAENLLWLPDRNGICRVGLLDYQDAMLGHPAYDLVSLLQDARRDVPRRLQEEMLHRYLAKTTRDEAAFGAAYAAMGAQRNLRILGVFARLSMHYGKPQYIDLIPRVWDHLMVDLAHPSLAALKRASDALLPTPSSDILERLKEKCSTVPTP